MMGQKLHEISHCFAEPARFNGHRDANIRELNAHLARLVGILEVEKKRQWWWGARTNELGLSEFQQLGNALQELKRNAGKQVNLLHAAVESSNFWP
ncbi:hypothetical protein V6N13_058313 [Hibiscus sabdariffa]